MKLLKPFIFTLLAVHGLAAQPGFNLPLDMGYPLNHLRDMIVHNDTIIGYGIALDDTIQWKQVLILVKMDSSGNIVGSTMIQDSLGDKLAIDKDWGKIIATSDGGYAMTAATVNRNSALLIKVNGDLEVEFIKEYQDTNLLSNFNYKILEIAGGYLLYGSVQDMDIVDRPFVRRVDKEGYETWNNLYGNPNYWGNILDVKMLNDSVLVAGSVHLTTSDLFGPSRTSLYFIHIDGTLLDEWHSPPDPSIGYLRKLIVLDDGGLLIYGLTIIDKINTTYVVQPALSKLDQDLNIKWTKKYGRIAGISAQITFHDIEPTIDGNYTAAGESSVQMGSDPSLRSGWLMKFSPEGDSIWSRYDRAPFPPHFGNDNFFGGVGVLSSGSIVAGGTATEGPDRYIWLVKVTNDGCLDTLFCGLVPVHDPSPQVDITVFPNPCRESVNITLTDYLPRDAKAVLYDATGQRQKVQPLHTGWNTLLLDGLQKGLYFYEIREGGVLLKSGKLVKI